MKFAVCSLQQWQVKFRYIKVSHNSNHTKFPFKKKKEIVKKILSITIVIFTDKTLYNFFNRNTNENQFNLNLSSQKNLSFYRNILD